MITILKFAMQTIFGWTVITCGVPVDDFQVRPEGGFSEIRYVCLVELEGDQKYIAKGVFSELRENDARFKLDSSGDWQ